MSASLPKPIRTYLRSFIARQRAYALLRAMGIAMGIALAWAIVACAVDRWLQLSPGIRLALLGMGAIAVAVVLAPPLGRLLRRRTDWVGVADEIEKANPDFGERLRTVISQLLEKQEYRGSPQMLDYLVEQVSRQAAEHRPRFAWKPIALPWAIALCLLIVAAGLWRISSPNGPLLLSRLVRPLNGTTAVTSTLIRIEPGNERLLRGKTLVVRAHVQHLSGAGVDISMSQDGQSWTRIPMLPVSDSDYIFTLPAIERTLRYYVQGGDATTNTFTISVLRPPAIAEYRVRYDYPAYTQRNALTISNTDGAIEAVVGTKITLALVCTEPLRSAQLKLGDQKIALAATSDPHVVQTEITLSKSGNAELSLTSSEGLSAEVPARITIRAQPDREPVARLLRPVEDLRLHARDLLPLQYLAMDDYGISSLSVMVQVNSKPRQELPIKRVGDARRQEGQFTLDLAKLNVQIGDVVRVGLVAQDGAGKKIESERMRHILISPRSIDLNTHLRIAEMKQAAQLAAALRQELESAAESFARQLKTSNISESEFVAGRLRISRNLASAVEAGLLLHQSLLRVIAKSASTEQTMGLAECIDRARVETFEVERLVAMDAGGAASAAMTQPLQRLVDGARHVEGCVRILSEGEQAAAILADRGNVKAVPASQPADRAAADRLRETRRRAEQDIAFAVEELGLALKAPDLDAALQKKMDTARELLRAAKPIDFEPPAQQWSAALLKPVVQTALPLAERLASASTVEALRPDSDPIRARDLQMASRAASRLAEAPMHEAAETDPVRLAITELPQVVAALQREHQINRHPNDVRPPEELKTTREAAAAARQKLSKWSKLDFGAGAFRAPADVDDDELAFEGSFQAARRDYSSAAAVDRRLAKDDREGYERLHQDMSNAQAIDNVSVDQRKIAAETSMQDPQKAQELSSQQKNVAERITKLDASSGDLPQLDDSRPRMAAMISSVQESLAHMPQQMASAMEAAENYRQAMLKAEMAAREAASAPADRAGMARRMAEQAQAALKESQELLEKAAAPLAAEEAERIAKQLQSAGAEAEEASVVVGEQLQAALQVFGQSMRAGDKGAVERAAQHVRFALERSQTSLREAQATLIERDPLAAARWFARAAASALDERPPDFRKARTHQESASTALSRAWQTAMREAGVERLILTPTFRPLLRPPVIESHSPDGTKTPTQVVPGLRQWGYLPKRQPESLGAPIHEIDAPGYQEPLKLYFEALNKAQEKSDKAEKK
ncbi:MAG TPA: hypothetical protein VGQ99_12470 [Tepidisphaeraceae bacterium]|nr:hypothetical protein [Tepidisphaeraceae bacterium]